MGQPRHDMYTAIHKAIRSRLFDSARRLEGCDFSSAAERTAVLAHVRATVAFLQEHAGHEDTFVQPLLAEANPQLAERIAQAHERVDQSGTAVSKLVDALTSADADVALGRGPELCHAFNVLASQHLEHMNDEETLANAALWQGFSDEHLRQVQGTLQASVAPPRMAEWLGLMLPALNVHERIGVMGGMKAAAPPEAFQTVMKLGRDVVGEPWRAVEAALS